MMNIRMYGKAYTPLHTVKHPGCRISAYQTSGNSLPMINISNNLSIQLEIIEWV